MALIAGSRLQTAEGSDGAVAVKTDMVLDTETGLMVERKTVYAKVRTESGSEALLVGQQTRVAGVQVLDAVVTVQVLRRKINKRNAASTALYVDDIQC